MRRGVLDEAVADRHDPPALRWPAGRRVRACIPRRPRGPDDGSPPISPAIRTREHDEGYAAALTGHSPAAWRALCPRDRCASALRGARRAPAAQHLDRVERRMQPDRRVQRPPAQEHPAQRQADRQQRHEREQRPLGARRRRTRRTASATWARAKNTAPRMIAVRAPEVRAQAVVVKPRKKSSSPIGARIAAVTRGSPTSPAASVAAGGRWATARGTGSAARRGRSVTTTTGTASSAPSSRSRSAPAPGRTTPMSRHDSAPGPPRAAGSTPT